MNIPELVSKYDLDNQFEVLINSYRQIEYARQNEADISAINLSKVSNLIITGLGGSAIGGDLFINLFTDELNVPAIVNRNYTLPNFADEKSLVIVSSYSGNTEETLSAVNDALKKECQIICITTGGKLKYIAEENNLPIFILQKGLQPRYGVWINFFTLIKIAQLITLIPNQDSFFNDSIELIKRNGKQLSVENNKAYQIAESLCGFIPIIYSVADKTYAVGNRFKCQLNENSKLHAFHNVFPELDHNEIIGWETFNENKLNSKIIIINDKDYNDRNKKRIEITSRVIRKTGSEIIYLESEESNHRLRQIDLVYLGDWISYYLALLRGFDPSEIENINYLKNQLAEKSP
ncbi:MAG: bifunctional phosphoglucose/phosphomannose isomerase [Ignavibacteriae bacterium]|nr:bifunctional phosphoglucose/phosphomannose isomerase [Ignavibacteriota bacterium]NOG98329.1 bifunctional phosphoglucose/phosphomannose isomerase [Ignavibacteriota bacterium]